MTTKKDFEIIAKALKENMPNKEWLNKYQQWSKDIKTIADAFLIINPRFDTGRFISACGGELMAGL